MTACHAAARSRYQQSFQSNVFEAAGPPAERFIPAGKRRDQATHELFGSYNDKELHAMPKTFIPRDVAMSARETKMQFLDSDVLPHNRYGSGGYDQAAPYAPHGDIGNLERDDEDVVAPTQRRHNELSSELFGRGTPFADPDKASTRLTPNDFKWFNHPEAQHQHVNGTKQQHKERSYQEKCSTMFDRNSPDAGSKHGHHAEQQQQKFEENDGDAKRRHNAHYSDMFGRGAAMDVPQQQEGGRYHRPKHQSHPEEKMCIHQDWTDSKTENNNNRPGTSLTPGGRKQNELHQVRVFGQEGTGGYHCPDILEPTLHDNSQKIKNTLGMHTQHVHQAHLRTSTTPDDFYENAHATRDWEVVELHVSGLPSHADDKDVKRLCQGHDLQIIKVSVETDPVGNYCKGRAKIMVRYNPTRDNITSLVKKLEDSKLKVEL